MIERAERDGWKKRRTRTIAQIERWKKSYQNVTVYHPNGNPHYWAMDRPALIHNGRKA